MGLFNFFKKKSAATQGEQTQKENNHIETAQSKTYICARCKKEITDEESKWIGNHRFCNDCAAPFRTRSAFPPNYQPKFPEFKCSICGDELPIADRHKKLCIPCEWAQEKASEKKEIFKMITVTGQTHEFAYSGHTRYSPNRSSTSGYGSDDWFYLCEEKSAYFLIGFSDTQYGAIWRCTKLLEGDYESLVKEDVDFWISVAWSKERTNIHGIRLTNIESVRHLLPTHSRCRVLNDEDYLG